MQGPGADGAGRKPSGAWVFFSLWGLGPPGPKVEGWRRRSLEGRRGRRNSGGRWGRGPVGREEALQSSWLDLLLLHWLGYVILLQRALAMSSLPGLHRPTEEEPDLAPALRISWRSGHTGRIKDARHRKVLWGVSIVQLQEGLQREGVFL